MSDPRPKRYTPREAPETPSGYRTTRRASKALKTAKRAQAQHRALSFVDRLGHRVKNFLLVLVYLAAGAAITALVLFGIAAAVNRYARWEAHRDQVSAPGESTKQRASRENILIIGADGGRAAGYLAMRVDTKSKQVFGIAIPDGAFIDVPGQGFERVGEAFVAGPDVVLATVSNFLSVPFDRYVIVPGVVYRDALTAQSVSGIIEAVTSDNLSDAESQRLEDMLADIDQKDVNLVPMPVKPIKLADQTYFEPQREEIVDLLESWWGIDPAKRETVTRVILYNGAGVPGIAGEAAQVLIRKGFRVVDTKNADRFDYKKTQIIVRRGDDSRGTSIREALGAGEVKVETSTADVTDVIVIVGKDYVAPKNTGGTQ